MEHGFDWSKADDFLDLYFGEGMKSIWNHFHHNTQVFATTSLGTSGRIRNSST